MISWVNVRGALIALALLLLAYEIVSALFTVDWRLIETGLYR